MNNEKKLDHWAPHLHLSYYDVEESYDVFINNIYSKNGIIEIKNTFFGEFRQDRRNPFDHNSIPKKENVAK